MASFDLSVFDRDRADDLGFNRGDYREGKHHHKSERLDGNRDFDGFNPDAVGLDQRGLREECIIAFKVYDSCRHQDCLGACEIGPARAAEDVCICEELVREGDVIDPPREAAAVTIDRLRVKKIIIAEKRPHEFRSGFWTIDLKYVFEYRLVFREADGQVIGAVRANSIFNKKVTLFGSIDSEFVIGTDLLCGRYGENETLDADPFVWVEAKAVALEAKLCFQRLTNRGREDFAPEPNEVVVTIGLFSIIKLFRIVNLSVESRGFCIPEKCEEISVHPCEFFEDLDFPMDIFAPPQKREFMEGVSSNIPRREDRNHHPCGC